jgi:hypothetical protein
VSNCPTYPFHWSSSNISLPNQTAKSVDQTISAKAVSGIEKGEELAQKAKETAGMSAAEAKNKASEAANQAQAKAEETAGMSAAEAKGKAQGKAEEMKGSAKSTAAELEGQAKGTAAQAEGKAKSAAAQADAKAKQNGIWMRNSWGTETFDDWGYEGSDLVSSSVL